MSDISGADFSAIANGGDSFLRRLKEFSEAKEMMDRAAADLKLGRSLQDAKKEVDETNALAQKTLIEARQEAERILVDARQKEAEILAEARNNAKSMMDDARAKMADEAEIARERLSALEASLSNLNDAARGAHAEAIAARDEATHLRRRAAEDAEVAARHRSDLKSAIHEAVKPFVDRFGAQ